VGTDELDERIELLYQCGFCDEAGRDGLRRVVDALVRECGVKRDDEVLGMLVTHVAAALKRVREGEAITPLSPEIVEEVRSSPAYAEAKRIRDELIDALGFELPEAEKDFVLVHVGGLLLLQANE